MVSQQNQNREHDLHDVTVALPDREMTGWGVCTSNLTKALRATHPSWEFIHDTKNLPIKRKRIIGAIVDPMFTPWPPYIWGQVQCAYGFIEDNVQMLSYLDNAEHYWHHICCGSTWMREQLQEAGYQSCSVAVQGVDHIQPVTRDLQRTRNSFVVFSGGKFEFRKSQDLVIAAMRQVMRKYDDIRFVCAWGNPWLRNMDTMAQSQYIKYYSSPPNWQSRILGTLERNGLQLDRCEVLSLRANSAMPDVYCRCDLALFPNRCEGGTNLVAMEAIACGLPSIISYSSGHKDIVSANDPLVLKNLRTVAAVDSRGIVTGRWQEPLLDELIERIEFAYSNHRLLQEQAVRKASEIRRFTWPLAAKAIETGLQSADATR
jgi:glycosyltransferase involved in cell wall biosynthesis